MPPPALQPPVVAYTGSIPRVWGADREEPATRKGPGVAGWGHVPRGLDTWKASMPCFELYPFSLSLIKRYFQRDRQNPERSSARPLATLPARRTTRRGLQDATLRSGQPDRAAKRMSVYAASRPRFSAWYRSWALITLPAFVMRFTAWRASSVGAVSPSCIIWSAACPA